MECPLCGHEKTQKYGKMLNGHQRYFCNNCKKTFDTLYYHRHLAPEKVNQVLQAHREGVSLRSISRVTGVAYNTVVSIIRAASTKALLVHNSQVKAVETEEVSGDEMWSFVKKNKSSAGQKRLK